MVIEKVIEKHVSSLSEKSPSHISCALVHHKLVREFEFEYRIVQPWNSWEIFQDSRSENLSRGLKNVDFKCCTSNIIPIVIHD
jgi:hypothetical protein